MSSALKPADRERLLRGITKRVGNKPYENGNWGANPSKDKVLIELYDSGGKTLCAWAFLVAKWHHPPLSP